MEGFGSWHGSARGKAVVAPLLPKGSKMGGVGFKKGAKGDILPYSPLLDSAVPKGTRWVVVGWLGEGVRKKWLIPYGIKQSGSPLGELQPLTPTE